MNLIQNKKFQNALSVVSVLYLAFIIWLCSACYSYYFEYSSLKLLYIIYCLLNIVFAVPMAISSKTVLTAISTLLMLPANLILLIITIQTGDWLIAIPTILVNIVIFILLNIRYTTKALLATLTAVMYVMGIMGYILYTTLFGKFPFHNFSGSERYTSMDSPNGEYRYVAYIKKYASSQKIDVYIEPTNEDINLGIVRLEHYNDNLRIYSSNNGIKDSIVWENDNTLIIDGEKKTFDATK